MPSRPPRRRVLTRAVAALALVAAAGATVVAVGPLTRDGDEATTTPAPHHAREARLAHVRTVTGEAARRAKVPILMYHVLADPPAGAPYPELWVSPAAFAGQVAALAAAGYHGVTLSQVFAAWRRGSPLPAKPVVLSFDDGYQSQGVVAGGALHALGWPGVLNLAIRNAGPGGITVARLQRLEREGWEIDSHTVDHVDLTAVDAATVREQLVASRAWIGRHVGRTPAFFCYPGGRFDATVVAAVRDAGYRGATTELAGVAGPGDDPYELPRVRVVRGETSSAVLASIRR